MNIGTNGAVCVSTDVPACCPRVSSDVSSDSSQDVIDSIDGRNRCGFSRANGELAVDILRAKAAA